MSARFDEERDDVHDIGAGRASSQQVTRRVERKPGSSRREISLRTAATETPGVERSGAIDNGACGVGGSVASVGSCGKYGDAPRKIVGVERALLEPQRGREGQCLHAA